MFRTDNLAEALSEEIRLIALYGRRNIGTGFLSNMTNGGTGGGGRAKSKEEIEAMRARRLNKTFEQLFGEEKATMIKKAISEKATGRICGEKKVAISATPATRRCVGTGMA